MASWADWKILLEQKGIKVEESSRMYAIRDKPSSGRRGKLIEGGSVIKLTYRSEDSVEETEVLVPNNDYEHLDERLVAALVDLELDPEEVIGPGAQNISEAVKEARSKPEYKPIFDLQDQLLADETLPEDVLNALVSDLASEVRNRDSDAHESARAAEYRFSPSEIQTFARQNGLKVEAKRASRNSKKVRLTITDEKESGRHRKPGEKQTSLTLETDNEEHLSERQIADVAYTFGREGGADALLRSGWQDRLPNESDPNRFPLEDDPNNRPEDDRRSEGEK